MKLHTAVFVHLDLGDLDWAHQLPVTTQLGHGVFRAKARWCWELIKAREWLQGACQLGRVSGKGNTGNAIERCQSRCWWWKGRFILLFDCLLLNLMLMFFSLNHHIQSKYMRKSTLFPHVRFFNVALHTGAYKKIVIACTACWQCDLQPGNACYVLLHDLITYSWESEETRESILHFVLFLTFLFAGHGVRLRCDW